MLSQVRNTTTPDNATVLRTRPAASPSHGISQTCRAAPLMFASTRIPNQTANARQVTRSLRPNGPSTMSGHRSNRGRPPLGLGLYSGECAAHHHGNTGTYHSPIAAEVHAGRFVSRSGPCLVSKNRPTRRVRTDAEADRQLGIARLIEPDESFSGDRSPAVVPLPEAADGANHKLVAGLLVERHPAHVLGGNVLEGEGLRCRWRRFAPQLARDPIRQLPDGEERPDQGVAKIRLTNGGIRQVGRSVHLHLVHLGDIE